MTRPYRILKGITYGHRVLNSRRDQAARALAQALGDALFGWMVGAP